MEADARWCPHCKLKGDKKRQRLLQINDSLAVLLCENDKCVNLGKKSLTSTASLILERKSSEIPNTKRKKSRSVPVIGATPKSSDQRVNIDIPNSDDPITSGNLSTPTSSSKSSNVRRDEATLLRTMVSAKTMPLVLLWRNKGALCWLDACLCILIASRSLRACLARLPETSLVRTLCLKFVGAQRTATTTDGASQDVDALCPSDCPPRDTCPAVQPAENLQQDTDERVPIVDRIENSRDVRAVTERSSEALDKAREELFRQLRPSLKCDYGQEDSPVVALPILLRLDGSLEEHFLCRYRWEFYCTVCGYTKVIVNKKSMLTFVKVPVDFNMAHPVMLQSCSQCGSPSQSNHLVFHSLPACVMLHFQDGLPDSNLARHHSFSLGKDTYSLKAVVRYRHNPNHFVTLIRDDETNHWLEYDDILSSPFSWRSQAPQVPADEIHIMVWERLGAPCTACQQMQNDVNGIRDDAVAAAAESCIPAGGVRAVPRPRKVTLWNGNGTNGERHRTSPPRRERGAMQNGLETRRRAEDDHGFAADEPERADGKDVRLESIDPLDGIKNANGSAQGASRLCIRGTLARGRFCGFNQDSSTTTSNPSEPTSAVAPDKTEPTYQVEIMKRGKKPNAKAMQMPPNDDLTFISKVKSQQTSQTNRYPSTVVKSKASSVLRRIPEQLLKHSRVSNTSSRLNMDGREGLSTNTSVLSRIPKQLQSGMFDQQTAPPQCNVESRGKASGPIAVSSSCRAPKKQAKFQPYGRTTDNLEAHLPKTHLGQNTGTLTTWQKRVGRFSTGSTVPAKRMRQDSADDTSGFADLPKHAGPPYSTVPSPSMSSDVSSLSDNLSLTSGSNDLAATIDELCKVLDISSECTPSVSSRFSSPSQDMFLSELMADEATWAGLEDQVDCLGNPNPVTTAATAWSEISCSSVTPSICPPSLQEGGFPDCQDMPSLDFFQSLLNPTDDLPEAPSEETLPSAGQLCPSLVSSCTPPPPPDATAQSSMSPSCARLLSSIHPVALQPEASATLNGHSVHVTLSNDHMSSGCGGLGPLYDCSAASGLLSASLGAVEANIEAVTVLDETTNPGFFNGILENLDTMENEAKENLVELLAQ